MDSFKEQLANGVVQRLTVEIPDSKELERKIIGVLTTGFEDHIGKINLAMFSEIVAEELNGVNEMKMIFHNDVNNIIITGAIQIYFDKHHLQTLFPSGKVLSDDVREFVYSQYPLLQDQYEQLQHELNLRLGLN